jgi:hypothetical protein
MTLSKLAAILRDIECSVGEVNWKIHCGRMGDGFYLQLRYIEADIGRIVTWFAGRRGYRV